MGSFITAVATLIIPHALLLKFLGKNYSYIAKIIFKKI
jgi:hypothetical protein